MTLETETVLDRRRLRRQVTLWRTLGVLVVGLAAGALVLGNEKLAALAGTKQIARVAIEGTITEDREQLKLLKKLAETDRVAAVLVYVNSPGGTTAGGEALYQGLRAVAEKKPVVAQFGTVAASAGYIAGLGTDYIVARGNTITGSIGVLIQWPEVTDLLDKVGVKMNTVKSGELKASPNPFEPLNEDSRRVTEEMIRDGFRWFVSLVEERRKIKTADVPGLMKGRIFSGREAVEAKLVDEIGGEDEAVKYLVEKRKIDKKLKVVDWRPEATDTFGFSSSASRLGLALLGAGAAGIQRLIGADRNISTLGLDGLVSVWHPSEN